MSDENGNEGSGMGGMAGSAGIMALVLMFKACAIHSGTVRHAFHVRPPASVASMAAHEAGAAPQFAGLGDDAGTGVRGIYTSSGAGDGVAGRRLLKDLHRVRPHIPSSSAHDLADQPANGARVLSLLPESEQQFAAVFGRSASAMDSREMRQLIRMGTGDGGGFRPAIASESEFAAVVGSSDENLVVVLGHSTEGGMQIHFPSGFKLELNRLHELCTYQKKVCVTLTCHSKDLGFKDVITARTALELSNTARTYALLNPNATVRDVIESVKLDRVMIEGAKEIRVAFTTVGGGAAAYVVVDGTSEG